MADKKITELTPLLGSGIDPVDLFLVVDIGDTTMAASGTDKSVTASEMRIGLGVGQQTNHVSGYYYSAQCMSGFGTGTLIQAEEYAIPIWIPKTATYDRIGCMVTTAGSAGAVVRLGIYNDSGGRPGTVVVDAGTVATTSTGGKEITISQSLTGGSWYWLGLVEQGSPGTHAIIAGSYSDVAMVGFSALSMTNGDTGSYSRTGISGALSTWSTWATHNFCPRVVLRAP